MTDFKIETGIPFKLEYVRGHALKGALHCAISKMQIGDSIFSEKRLTGMTYYANLSKIKLSTRKVEGGYRVWRLE